MKAVGVAVMLVLQFVLVLVGIGFIVGCSEEAQGSGTREGACEVVTSGASAWFLAVLWPSALFAISQLFPWSREHGLTLALAIVVLAIAFWTSLFYIA